MVQICWKEESESICEYAWYGFFFLCARAREIDHYLWWKNAQNTLEGAGNFLIHLPFANALGFDNEWYTHDAIRMRENKRKGRAQKVRGPEEFPHSNICIERVELEICVNSHAATQVLTETRCI